jgi:hypothetical protein
VLDYEWGRERFKRERMGSYSKREGKGEKNKKEKQKGKRKEKVKKENKKELYYLFLEIVIHKLFFVYYYWIMKI